MIENRSHQRNGRLRRTAIVVVLAAAGVGAVSGTAQAAPKHDGAGYVAGAPGSGDEYFPYAGNGGYDVLNYDLALRYAPPADPGVLEGRLTGVATVTLRAKQDLQSLNFDLRGLNVTSVRVDGKAAKHGQIAGRGQRRVVTGTGRREPHLGTHHRAATEAEGRTKDDDRHRVRRDHRPAARHHRGPLRVGHHR